MVKGGMGHNLLFSTDFREKFFMEKGGKPWHRCSGISVPAVI